MRACLLLCVRACVRACVCVCVCVCATGQKDVKVRVRARVRSLERERRDGGEGEEAMDLNVCAHVCELLCEQVQGPPMCACAPVVKTGPRAPGHQWSKGLEVCVRVCARLCACVRL